MENTGFKKEFCIFYGDYLRTYPCRYVYLTLDYISLLHS